MWESLLYNHASEQLAEDVKQIAEIQFIALLGI